jgi:hypothetical protein
VKQALGFIKAVYNFFVGDPVILAGVAIIFVALGIIIKTTVISAGPALAVILVAGVIASLSLSLYREIQPKSK